jgi:hypothetical protein
MIGATAGEIWIAAARYAGVGTREVFDLKPTRYCAEPF